MTGKVTSQQVAELAGVSQSAVSRVFTPGASVSKKMALKVRESAEQLGYRPNVLARAMVSGKSRIIGIVVSYFENQFYTEILAKFSEALKERGYHILIFMASVESHALEEVMNDILDYQVDGIIVASVNLTSDIVDGCHSAGVPVVLFNRSQDIAGVSAITSENFAGGRKVADFLLSGGHKKIGYIAGWEQASTQRDRERGLISALEDANVEMFAREVGNFNTEEAREATRRMFQCPEEKRPDAVFVANDHMALTVMDVLRYECNLRIPEDVSVVGYDDAPPAAWPTYNLTTVRQRSNIMVEETLNALFEWIESPETARCRTIAIDGPLMVRGSARLPEANNTQGITDERF